MNKKNLLNKIVIGVVSFGLIITAPLTLTAQAADTENMTKVFNLDRIVEEVAKNNPELKLLEDQILVQERRYKIANQKADEIKSNEWLTGGDFAQSKSYILLYPLQAKNKLDDLNWQKENKIISLRADASKLYYQYIFKQHEVEAQSKAVERAMAELKIVKGKIDLGKLSSLSLPQSENAVDLSNQKLTKLNTELTSIAMKINSLLNYDLDQKLQISSDTIKVEEYTIKDIESLIEKRKLESNSIKKLQGEIEEAKTSYYIESYNRQSIASNYEQLEDRPRNWKTILRMKSIK